jgi:hypothetical protein
MRSLVVAVAVGAPLLTTASKRANSLVAGFIAARPCQSVDADSGCDAAAAANGAPTFWPALTRLPKRLGSATPRCEAS